MTSTNPPENGGQNERAWVEISDDDPGLIRFVRDIRLVLEVDPSLAALHQLVPRIAALAKMRFAARTGQEELDSTPSPACDRADVLRQLDELRTAALDAAKDCELHDAQASALQVGLEAVTTKASLLGLFPVMNSYEGRPAPDTSWINRDA